jgi:hypothetical protein
METKLKTGEIVYTSKNDNDKYFISRYDFDECTANGYFTCKTPTKETWQKLGLDNMFFDSEEDAVEYIKKLIADNKICHNNYM